MPLPQDSPRAVACSPSESFPSSTVTLFVTTTIVKTALAAGAGLTASRVLIAPSVGRYTIQVAQRLVLSTSPKLRLCPDQAIQKLTDREDWCSWTHRKRLGSSLITSLNVLPESFPIKASDYPELNARGGAKMNADHGHRSAIIAPLHGASHFCPVMVASQKRPITHTTDPHSFFVRNGDLPANIYRFDFVSGTRQFVRQLRPSDVAGMERIGDVLMTPDGKYYVYGGSRELSNLFVVSGLK